MSTNDDRVSDAEINRRIAFADAALGAAGHTVTDLQARELARQVAAGKLTGDEAVAGVLAGTDSYDSLGEQEQAIVREQWADSMTALRDGLNYEEEITAAGDSYSEIDDDGNLVVHQARG